MKKTMILFTALAGITLAKVSDAAPDTKVLPGMMCQVANGGTAVFDNQGRAQNLSDIEMTFGASQVHREGTAIKLEGRVEITGARGNGAEHVQGVEMALVEHQDIAAQAFRVVELSGVEALDRRGEQIGAHRAGADPMGGGGASAPVAASGTAVFAVHGIIRDVAPTRRRVLRLGP